jgi:hypothetical protein
MLNAMSEKNNKKPIEFKIVKSPLLETANQTETTLSDPNSKKVSKFKKKSKKNDADIIENNRTKDFYISLFTVDEESEMRSFDNKTDKVR